jgi:hypothetical protein
MIDSSLQSRSFSCKHNISGDQSIGTKTVTSNANETVRTNETDCTPGRRRHPLDCNGLGGRCTSAGCQDRVVVVNLCELIRAAAIDYFSSRLVVDYFCRLVDERTNVLLSS